MLDKPSNNYSGDEECYFHETGEMTPNDPKLSEPRGWRDRCAVGARRRPEAAGVTAARVRCSAWLGVAVIFGIDVECDEEIAVCECAMQRRRHTEPVTKPRDKDAAE